MGNIPLVYQNRIADAGKKCMELKNAGLKTGGISGLSHY